MTDEPEPREASGDELRERQAAEWCALMHDRHTTEDRTRFDEWLRDDPLNLEAYNRMEEVYRLGSKARRTSADGPESSSLPGWEARRLRWYGLGLAAAVVISAGSYVALQRQPSSSEHTSGNPEFATTGELRRLLRATDGRARYTLPDGSIVTLADRSVVSVTFSRETRSLALLIGKARFEVAHEARPFVVAAGGGTVTARGTIFEVSIREDHKVEVRLERGLVAVALPVSPAGHYSAPATQELHPGEKIVFDQKDEVGASAVSIVPLPVSTGGDQPRTVGELIEQTNATHAGTDQIELGDTTLASRSLGGAFKVHDPATVAERLSLILGLAIDRSVPGRIILRRTVSTNH